MIKHDYILALYDFYQKLLTDKQKKYFESYYFLDLSISEIASDFGLSRNGVFDQIKKVEDKLKSFEEKLGLYKKYQLIEEKLADSKHLDEILEIMKE